MPQINLLLVFIFLSFLANSSQLVFAKGGGDNVKEACKVTSYPNLCISSLAPFSNSAGRSPSKWARAGVSVAIGEVKNVRSYLVNLKKHARLSGKDKDAVSDCVGIFGDALDELHKSLSVLRKLSRNTFGTQMGDLKTWISASLAYGETCLDGFQDKKGKKIQLLQNRVRKVSYVTSNALALVNKFATTGLD